MLMFVLKNGTLRGIMLISDCVQQRDDECVQQKLRMCSTETVERGV